MSNKELKWIPVSEKLPETERFISCNLDRTETYYESESNFVLVSYVTQRNRVQMCVAQYREFSDGTTGWTSDTFDCYGDLVDADSEGVTVLAWMPLPEPYKKEN